MAEVTKTEKIVVPEKFIPAVKETSITLVISEAEARVLSAILARISGSPTGYRGQADNVLQGLKRIGYGYEYSNGDFTPEYSALAGTFFKN